MQDHEKTREQLIAELGAIREKMSELEQRQIRLTDSETYLQDDPQTMSRFLDVAQDPDVEIATDDIAKFIDFPQLQSLMDDFYKLTKIGMAIMDLKGNLLVATGWQDICVKFHRVHPEALENCIESDLKLSANVKEGEYRIYKCKNNMWDMVTPIFVAQTHVCNLYLGQFLFEGETPDLNVFSEQAERYGFDRGAYLASLERVPRWDREKVNTVMTFYSKFASLVGQLSYSNLRLSGSLEHQKILTASLRQSRNTLETILSASPDGIGHAKGRMIMWVNEAWIRMFGFESEQECIGKSARIIYPSDEEFERVGAALYSGMKGEKVTTADAIFQRKDGSTFDGHIRIRAVDSDESSRGSIASISDISERKKAEREIRTSEERLQLALDGANLGMWDLNMLTGRAVTNSRSADIIGYDLEEIDPTMDFWKTIIHPEDLNHTLELLKTHIEGKTDFFEHEYRVTTRHGEQKWIMGRGKVIERDGLGQAIRMAGTFMDITERKESQERLRESEERFRLSFENANVGECLVDVSGRFIKSNHALSEIFGYSREELEKMTVNDIVYPDDASVSPTFMRRAKSGEVAKASFEKRYFHKSGNIVWGKVSSSLVRDAKGNPMYFVSHVQDITGLKRAEQEKEALYEQLLQAQKMEALGTLVGGIAHDFNNMLQIIMGYSQILLMDRDQNDKDYKDLKNILFTAQQQADLVSRLLQFARKAPLDPGPLDLNRRITELATVMFKTFPKIIDTRLDLAADLKNVMADRIQMDQVIMNLAINARDAMPNGGLLKIETKNVILGAGGYRAIHGVTPGPYIGVFISDTGGGIVEDDIKRIFEPFFSTKQRGSDRGTGLGLSVVKGIVEQHGGYITCDSAPGKGTEFTVFLPSIEVPSFADEKVETCDRGEKPLSQ